MSDMNSLNGSSVRDTGGRTGRIVSVTEAAVNLAWMQKGLIAEETQLQRTALAPDLQVLTLKEGWQPLVAVAGVTAPVPPSKVATLVEDLRNIVEASKSKPSIKKKKATSFGKKKHSPFKRFGLLGPGPDHSFGTREVSRQTRWDCTKTGKNKQLCTKLKKDAKGRLRRTTQKKAVHIDPGYKASYNQAYKAWSAKQGWHSQSAK